VFDVFLVQDHSVASTCDTFEVKEANGLSAQGNNISLKEYRELWVESDEPANEESNQELRRLLASRKKRLRDPLEVKNDSEAQRPEKRQRSDEFEGLVTPEESVFRAKLQGYGNDPLYFFQSVIKEFAAYKVPLSEELPTNVGSLEVVSYWNTTFHRSSMGDTQKKMLGSIAHHFEFKKNATEAERVANDFISYNSMTAMSLGQLCSMWLQDLTLDSQIKLISSSEKGFILSCGKSTRLCQRIKAEHKTNKIFFLFDIETATATQYCHNKTVCGGLPGAKFELPLKIRCAMFLAKTWRSLFLDILPFTLQRTVPPA
jgi:hypothetical protein